MKTPLKQKLFMLFLDMGLVFKLYWVNRKKALDNMTENDIIIRWADNLISTASHLGIIDIQSFNPNLTTEIPKEVLPFRKEVIKRLGNIDGQLDLETKMFDEYREGIFNHLLDHRYIYNPNKENEFQWVLSKRGWIAKELGGHYKYQKYRKDKLNVIKNQSKVNWYLFSAAVASAIFPFIIAIWLQKDTKVIVTPQNHISLPQVDTQQLRGIVEDVLKSKDLMKQKKQLIQASQ